jgi:hypothetical protein
MPASPNNPSDSGRYPTQCGYLGGRIRDGYEIHPQISVNDIQPGEHGMDNSKMFTILLNLNEHLSERLNYTCLLWLLALIMLLKRLLAKHSELY